MLATSLQQKALKSALRGLDFYLNNQVTIPHSADFGRYPYIANCTNQEILVRTTNWITGIQCSVMLNAYQVTGDERYLESAKRAVVYLKSLQEFRPWLPEVWGSMHEATPQDDLAHPRDGLSAALGLLDFAIITGDEETLTRAKLFADWFITYGMDKGYPYWTFNFIPGDWEPFYHGSFHAGSAYFLTKISEVTQDSRYLQAAKQVLNFYNTNMIDENGKISVIRQHDTMEILDDCKDLKWAPIGWIKMHQFNDDFGALANMHLSQVTGDTSYAKRAVDFLQLMKKVQRPDGGFGPTEWPESIPNAAGMILIELMNARRLNLVDESYDAMAARCTEYLIAQQFNAAGHPFDGAFHGVDDTYKVNHDFCNARATTYAILALFNVAGWKISVFNA